MENYTVNLISGEVNDFTTTHDVATDADATYIVEVPNGCSASLEINCATLDDTDGTVTWGETNTG